MEHIEQMLRIKELVGEINSIMTEMMSESELPPKEKKQKEKEKYLKMAPTDREVMDKKKLLEEPAKDDENA